MEQIASNHNNVRLGRHDVPNGSLEHTSNISLPLIYTVSCLTVILPAPEMHVAYMSKLHSARVAPGIALLRTTSILVQGVLLSE
jgi:hypothetical protein